MTQMVTEPEVPAAVVAADIRKAERTDRIVGIVQRQGALAVLVVVVLIALATWPNFRSFDNTATILVAAAPPMLIALGHDLRDHHRRASTCRSARSTCSAASSRRTPRSGG